MTLLTLATLCCAIANHAYYQYLDGKGPSSSLHISDTSDAVLDQTVVSDVGIALSYAGQALLTVAMASSGVQLFWRTIRSRGLSISQIDALTNVQSNPVSPSFFRALRTSLNVPLLALLAASMSSLSIFAPGSIKISPSYSQLEDCTVLAPRNLSNLTSSTVEDTKLGFYTTPIVTALSSGTYLPPVAACGSGRPASQCSYEIQFIGPGLTCEDTTPRNSITAIYYAAVAPQAVNDLTMRLFVQVWDSKLSISRAVNCTGVLRSYSASLNKMDSAININVTEARIISAVHANISQLSIFTDSYLFDTISSLEGSYSVSSGFTASLIYILSGGIGTIELDDNITWHANLSLALEVYVQNATLSLLSGQIFNLNPNDPETLENITTTCTYSFTAYELYALSFVFDVRHRNLVTLLCAIWGSVAIGRNGVEESMDFSRILRAVLNERLYNANESLDMDTKLEADETVKGELVPSFL